MTTVPKKGPGLEPLAGAFDGRTPLEHLDWLEKETEFSAERIAKQFTDKAPALRPEVDLLFDAVKGEDDKVRRAVIIKGLRRLLAATPPP